MEYSKCPHCGSEEFFERYEKIRYLKHIPNDEFDFIYSSTHESDLHTDLACSSCEKVVDLKETKKQRKLILKE